MDGLVTESEGDGETKKEREREGGAHTSTHLNAVNERVRRCGK